jgi:hypothetical protein
MKKLFIGIILLFPSLCGANQSLEFELVRTAETPGFFAVTIFPSRDTEPLHERIAFVKNFSPEEQEKYEPIVSFLTELGAKVVDTLPTESQTLQVVTLGNRVADEQNFHINNENSPLEQFEYFSLQNLKPIFFRNLRAEFGGNISAVEQSHENVIGDEGVTFIGKFEKDMRTRMAIVADDATNSLEFEAPLDLSNTDLSRSPLAPELPQLWEQLQQKEESSSSTSTISWFPWILGGIGILILVIVFMRNSMKKYNAFLKKQDSFQEELPWKKISKEADTYSNPFEIE